MSLFDAMIMNANNTPAAFFSCVFATNPTSFLRYIGATKMVYSIMVSFIFDTAFGWQDFSSWFLTLVTTNTYL